MLQDLHRANKGEQHATRGQHYGVATAQLGAERAEGKHKDVSNRDFKKLKTARCKARCEG